MTKSQIRWRLSKKQQIFEKNGFQVHEDIYTLPNETTVSQLRFEGMSDFVIVIASRGEKILVISQYNPVLGMELIEFPGGKIGKDEKPAKAASREFLEETGYEIRDPFSVGTFYPNPRRTSLKCHVFGASVVDDSRIARAAEDEYIRVLWVDHESLETIFLNSPGNGSMLAAWLMHKL